MVHFGLLSFSDGRDRVHEMLIPDILEHEQAIIRLLESTEKIKLYVGQEIVHSAESARREMRRLASFNLDGVIFNIPVFAFPNYVVIAAQFSQVPILLLGPHDPRYPGLTGLLAVGGSLTQLGIKHERLWLDLTDPSATEKILLFGTTAAAVSRLRGQVYGLVGGRSIGMYTGASPAELWTKDFGIDIDHVDQSEIIRLAKLISDDEVDTARSWLEENVKEIVYDPPHFTLEKLNFEIRCYIALKEIVSSYQFDFIGLKCHFDMSEYFSVQCLSAALMNDPYDWKGVKIPIPLACEADSDGALTMKILQMISGQPASLLDLRFFDPGKSVYVMPNCGSAPTWFAARSDEPAENLSRVRIVSAIKKYAGGGAHLEFVFGEGEVTMARLSRSSNGYKMLITNGETIKYPINKVMGAAANWPHAFVKIGLNPEKVIQKLEANHLHLVAGDYREELIRFCNMMDIEQVML